MRGIPRPSPAMVVALIALTIAIGGTAAALPGKFSVGQDDLKTSSVGARSIGKMIIEKTGVVQSKDPIAGDGIFTETKGSVRCPEKAPLAIDPAVAVLGPEAYVARQMALPNRWGAPGGYEFRISGDEGPEIGYTMTVNCLLSR